MAFEGMDIDVITSLAGQLDAQASHLNSTIVAIDGIVSQMEGSWKGPDATEFQGWWLQQHKPALQAAEAAISGLAQSARNNVSAQETASRG